MADGDEVAGGVEREHEQHRATEFQVKCSTKHRKTCFPAVRHLTPGVEHGPRVGEAKSGKYGWQTKLLKPENRRQCPRTRRAEPKGNRSARRSIGTNLFRR